VIFINRVLEPPITSYGNPGGEGNRILINPLQLNNPSGGSVAQLFNGVESGAAGAWWSTAAMTGNIFGGDFNAYGELKYVTEITLLAQGLVGGGWEPVYYEDAWTSCGAPVTWSASNIVIPVTPSLIRPEGFRYWGIRNVGTAPSSNPWIMEMKFKIASGAT
jgi:hypothetical protein